MSKLKIVLEVKNCVFRPGLYNKNTTFFNRNLSKFKK